MDIVSIIEVQQALKKRLFIFQNLSKKSIRPPPPQKSSRRRRREAEVIGVSFKIKIDILRRNDQVESCIKKSPGRDQRVKLATWSTWSSIGRIPS
jgi:hypothetical protein